MPALLLLALLAASATAAEASYVLPNITEQKVFDGTAFPDSRPALGVYRSLSTLLAPYTCEPKGNGFLLTLKHGRFDNITSAMVQWMFANMASAKVDINGTRIPMFLALHPADHASAVLESGSVLKGGSRVTFIEFPLTKCDGSGDGRTWTCPEAPQANPGFLKSSPADWQLLDSTNVTSKVLSFGKKKIRFGNQGCKPAGSPCAYVVKTTHTWKDDKKSTPPGLFLTSVVKVGIGMKENDKNITRKWANGLDYGVKCARVAAHMTQEYGSLQSWLAAAYKAANPGAV
ncbi:hypothetical protein Rsub_05707 [Raphidocelis subcapitata]|uniref:Uncharacterized protein n=1 Tax=Raphidocelis subcapitata TaxID=307507 RepID=A0A2V0NZQ4_9CHLO|nr:hypothetical protein Rsub_05707 [Raphidocelis subcapitata]|eukprot:GBF93096.1 hypothetical protein Rsub_05707 [Raphidocelis subcapitata]